MSDVTRRMAKGEAQVKATPKSLDDIVLEAVDKCSPTTDGERFCLYNIIETAAKDYSKASHDKLLEALLAIRDKDPNDEDVESWKWLARKFKELAEAAIQSAEEKPNAG